MSNSNDEGRIIGFKMGYKDPVTGEFKRDLFWERMGAQSGDPEAMVKLGVAYLQGDGVERDPVKGVEYFRQAAELDEPVAQYNMGIQCARGEGIRRDFAAAIAWMEKARDNGDEDAVKSLETLENAPEIEKKAYEGDAEAQARFSTLLGNFPSEANIRESVEMAERSVEQGCPRGYFALGSRYMYGMGVEKDEVKAAAIYKKGAELGNPDCQVRYAGCLREGEGVPQDYNGFIEWVEKAAAQGFAKAAVGLSLESKDGTLPISNEKLIEYLLKAAELEPDNADVAQHLGIQYINLEPSDFERSIYWYDRAGELGQEIGKVMASVYRYRQKLIDEGTVPGNIGAVELFEFLQENNLLRDAAEYSNPDKAEWLHEQKEQVTEFQQQRDAENQQHASEWLRQYGQYVEKDPQIVISGSKFVFTGITTIADKEALADEFERMKELGGEEKSAVSGKIDYLVCDPRGAGESKVKKVLELRAKGKNVKIILLEDFLKALGMD